MKKVNRTTPEGWVIDIATDSVVAYKCLQCSTVHYDESLLNDKQQLTEYLLNAFETHIQCNM